MKKRLLITSIVMMLVVAVALSTATYAWFTSSASVTANSITMTAATNQNTALEISYTNGEGEWLTEINGASPAGGFSPAAPNVFVKKANETTGTYLSAVSWKNADFINGKFVADGVAGKEYIWTDNTNDAHKSIFLHNASTANTISNITFRATIEGAAAPFIRVAIFKKDSTVAAGNFELYGVISNQVNYEKATSYDADVDYYYYDTSTTAFVADDTIVDAGTFATSVSSHGMVYYKSFLGVVATEYEAGVQYYSDSAAKTTVSIADASAFASAGTLYKRTTVYDLVTVGDVTSGKALSAMTTPAYCTTEVALGGLGVNDNAAYGADEMEVKVVIWMDGSALNDDTAGSTGKTASIALSFSAAR